MRLPTLMEQFETLVGLPSVSCVQPGLDQSNQGVVDQLAAWLEVLGFDCLVQPVRPGKANLIARRGSGILLWSIIAVVCAEGLATATGLKLNSILSFAGLGGIAFGLATKDLLTKVM